jgi:hypothetical protein
MTMLAAAIAIVVLGAAESPLEKPGKKGEAEVKKGVKETGKAVQKAGKKFDQGVRDALGSLKKSSDQK